MTLEQLLTEWMTNRQRERIKTQTWTRYQGLIHLHILPQLGMQSVETFTRRQINDFLVKQRKEGNLRYHGGLSAISVNLIHSILHMAFEYACDMEIVKENPCDKIRRAPIAENHQVKAFTLEEQVKLEQQIMKKDDVRLFGILLCFYTGLRIGELLSLEWTDFNENCTVLTVSKTTYRGKDDEGNWQIFVDTPKTKSSYRWIPLPEHISRKFSEIRKTSKSRYVISNKKHQRMSVRSYQYMFEKLTIDAEVRKLNFHAIRHTFTTRALERGMDVKTLSEIMGHKDVTITLNRYAHSMSETKIAMMHKMTKLYK